MTNAFIGRPAAPSDAELAAELGAAQSLWDRVRDEVALPCEWHSYSKKAGWSMRIKRKDRNIVYLSPGRREFEATFILGDRAIAAAKERGLAKMVEGARRYVEGTVVRLAVKKAKDVATVKKLVEIKLEF
jgi:hypothetical protein